MYASIPFDARRCRHVCEFEVTNKQSKEAFAGARHQLAAAGAGPADVVKLTTYVVDYSLDKLEAAFAGFGAVFGDPDTLPARTLIGVQSLCLPMS